MDQWHSMTAREVLERLDSSQELGLEDTQALSRLAEVGPNELEERGQKTPWRIFWEQLTSAMVVVLMAAAVVSAWIGDAKDAVAILVIIILNASLGFHQEYKAEKALAALKKLSVPLVNVRRGGHVQRVSAKDLVPGDIVLLETGNIVPADCRVLKSFNLRTQESALTGESQPVEKEAEPLGESELPLAERHNMAFMGTIVAYGRGETVVTETGMQTQLGHIATMIQGVGADITPLQRRLNQLGRQLALVSLLLVGIVVAIGILRGQDLKLVFLTGISLAVAAVPEGLPAVVTIALALGSQRMLKRKALIRKLPAVEALGSVTVICSDKTGTLTENRMTVTVIDVAEQRVDLSLDALKAGSPSNPGEEHAALMADGRPSLSMMVAGGTLCNDAVLTPDEERPDEFVGVGDPTESALLVVGARVGVWKEELEGLLPRVAELPFDSNRKRMTTIHEISNSQRQGDGQTYRLLTSIRTIMDAPYLAFTKGAVDSLLQVSDRVLHGNRIEPLDDSWRERIMAGNDKLAKDGMRILGIAWKPLESPVTHEDLNGVEENLIFIGLIGMIDPARPEARNAVATCKGAGIRPVMITGDHPLTAQTIARELGISGNGLVLTSEDLNRLSLQELEDIVEDVSVYARVSPEHKLKIVQALQDRGEIVAMTGDGVNDAPALKKADIGVAMGITGTDVAKEVSDMVLLDDNFATIVAAVEEGRIIYDNIRKFIKYTLTSNSGEIWVMLLAPFLGMPLPLLPLQILWINLLTDGLPGLAFAVEPAEPDTMRRAPYRPNENIFGRGMGLHIVVVGLIMGLVPLLAGFWYWHSEYQSWQTVVFTILTFSQMGQALAIRSSRESIFRIGLLSNKSLLGAVLLTFGLQIAVIYVPFFQEIFNTVDLPLQDLLYCFLLSSVVFAALEIHKGILRMRISRRDALGES